MFNPGPKFHLLFGADGGDDVRLKLWPQAHLLSSEFRSCVRVEVAVLGSPSSVMSLRVGFYGRKAKLNHAHALVTVCPQYVNRHPRALSSTSSSRFINCEGRSHQDGAHYPRAVERFQRCCFFVLVFVLVGARAMRFVQWSSRSSPERTDSLLT